MSPYDISKLDFNLKETLEKLGWKLKQKIVYHERDYDTSWNENVWMKNDEYIITETKMSEGLAKELYRLSKYVLPS